MSKEEIMSENKPTLTAPCGKCHRSTMHEVLYTLTEDGPDDYHCTLEYSVIKCRGCGEPSFRYEFTDYEASFPISDTEWEVPRTIHTYPRVLENHINLEGLYLVPGIVREVYTESLKAMQENAAILAGLGLRGTVEAICNERDIKGRNLEARITKLATEGHISKADAERLHAIRFLGNDAAHDIKKPTDEQLAIALRIIEHLIASVYILDEQAKGKLDTIVRDYEEFTGILHQHVKKCAVNDEFPIAKFMGKDMRRIDGSLLALETKLISEITSGQVTWLKLGKMDTYANSPSPLQHYVKT